MSNMGACCSDDMSSNHKQIQNEEDSVNHLIFQKHYKF